MQRKVNGKHLLVGNNANEGTSFVPQNITTEDKFSRLVEIDVPHVHE